MEARAGAEAEEDLALHADFDFLDAEAVPLLKGPAEGLIAAAEVTPNDGLEANEVTIAAFADVAVTADEETAVVTAAAEDAAVLTVATPVAEAPRV